MKILTVVLAASKPSPIGSKGSCTKLQPKALNSHSRRVIRTGIDRHVKFIMKDITLRIKMHLNLRRMPDNLPTVSPANLT